MDETVESHDVVELETPAENVFEPPSVDSKRLLDGASYSHYSPVPEVIAANKTAECVLGVDEAGRGPVIGPMVYGVFYLPLEQHTTLLADTHHFDDSKVLTPAVRSSLMEKLCTPGTDLFKTCGWATTALSAQDISAGMMRAHGSYNLNAQAMDATVELIHTVLKKDVNITEIYVDTIGPPASYQAKLERIFPGIRITVAKKADSLYPCVSAASVCAKVTRDAALEASYHPYATAAAAGEGKESKPSIPAWGSGYPSDARCSTWLKQNMDPLFGWGAECRFSWGTAKELLELKHSQIKVDWPAPDDDDGEDSMKMTDFFIAKVAKAGGNGEEEEGDDLSNWYGRRVTEEIF